MNIPDGSTSEVFEDLAAADARDMIHLLGSRAWSNFLAPLLIGTMNSWLLQLADPGQKRHWDKPDDYLRGGIAACRAILNAPTTIIAAQEKRNEDEGRETKETERYEDLAHGGRGPYGEDQAGISPTDPI